MKNIQASTIWRYAIYISISSIVTTGLNILHIKYILDIDPRPSLFFIPVIAGVFFGYLIAKLRPESKYSITGYYNLQQPTP